MSSSISSIWLFDVVKNVAVPAELHDSIETQQLDDWLHKWKPAITHAVMSLAQQGVPKAHWPQSRHWDWARKMGEVQDLLGARGFSVVCEGNTQGLMRVDLQRQARIPSEQGKHVVYVDYLEVAPWNRAELVKPHRFRGVGKAMLAAAIQLSVTEGAKGRIGLHSLPQANEFYRKCSMTELGPDSKYQNLVYFEMTPHQADEFLGKGQ